MTNDALTWYVWDSIIGWCEYGTTKSANAFVVGDRYPAFVLATEADLLISNLRAELEAERAEWLRLTAGIRQWASECGECGGTGCCAYPDRDNWHGTYNEPLPPCPACKGIRALLPTAQDEGERA
jgi:hypothetical protein